MIFKRKLALMELEQRIAPSYTFHLDSVVAADHGTSFSFVDEDGGNPGDNVLVTRDASLHGSISITDDDATSAADFDNIDHVVFNGSTDTTTSLTIEVNGSTAAGDGITEVGTIDFTAPVPGIDAIHLEGNVIGDAGVDSIIGTSLNTLDIHHDIHNFITDKGANIGDPYVGGNVAAVGDQTPINLGSGFHGTMTVEGAITSGGENGIAITGVISGATFNIGDMTDVAFDQYDSTPGANDPMSSTTINILGNTNLGLDGNLGGIFTDGTITGTHINVAGDLDARNLDVDHSEDVISTDWDGNGVGTITGVTLTMTNGGNIYGDITNNPLAYDGSALTDFQDLNVTVVTHGGNWDSTSTDGLALLSGGSITGSIDTADAGGDGFFNGDVVAGKDIGALTMHTGSLSNLGYGADFIADGEHFLNVFYTTPLPGGPFEDDGTINGLDLTTSATVNASTSFDNDFGTTDFDGDNDASGPMVFSVHVTDGDFDAIVVSGDDIGAAPTVIDVSGDFGGIITAFGDIDLLLTAGSATGTGLGNTGYIHAGDTDVAGSLSGSIVLTGGDAVNFDVRAFDNITSYFEVNGNVDADTTWDTSDLSEGAFTGNFAPDPAIGAHPGVYITGDFGGTISAQNDIKFADGTAFRIGGDFTSTAKLIADNNSGTLGNIDFDPASFECQNFAGTWAGDGILFDASSFIVHGDFTGSITAALYDFAFSNGSTFVIDGIMTGAIESEEGNISFTESNFFIRDFADGGTITADNNFTFSGDATVGNIFRFDEFDGALTATNGVISIENVSNPVQIGEFSPTGSMIASGDITFEDGSWTMDNFTGTIESLNGSIIFDDFDFIVNHDFSGQFLAPNGGITWDPSNFLTDNFSGLWSAGFISFDAGSTFVVTNYMSGIVEATTTDITFTDSDVTVETFGPSAKFSAEVNFTFDGDEAGDNFFDVSVFEGDITATTGAILFNDGTFDFGQMLANAQVAAGTSITFGDGDDDTDRFDATLVAGTFAAGTGVTFNEVAVEINTFADDGEFAANGGNVSFDDCTITGQGWFGDITATGDIAFDDTEATLVGDFGGDWHAGGSIEFTDTTLAIGGNFSGAWTADDDISFDPSSFTCEDFIGTWSSDNVFFTDSTFTANGDFIGSIEATDGEISFDASDLIVGDDFSGSMTASTDFSMSEGMFAVGGDFSGSLEATTGAIGFDESSVEIDGDFGGTWTAGTDISFDPSTFIVDGDFSGTWTAGDDIDFDEAIFNVGGDFSGSWTATDNIFFDSLLDDVVPFQIGGDFSGTWNAGDNIDFDNTDFNLGGNFTDTGAWTAESITFDGGSINIGGNYAGMIEATDGDVDISGSFNVGNNLLNFEVLGTENADSFFGGEFTGTIKSDTADVDIDGGINVFGGADLSSLGDFSGLIDAANNIAIGNVDIYGDMSGTIQSHTGFITLGDVNIGEDFSGLIEAFTDLTTGNFSVGAYGSDFSGTLKADTGFISLGNVDIEGDFTSTGLIEAATSVTTLDFSVYDDFAGTIKADAEFISMGNVDIGDDFTGLIEANTDLTTGNFSVGEDGSDFTGTLQADTGFIQLGDLSVDGLFSGLIDAHTNLTIGDVSVGGDFTGQMWAHTGFISLGLLDVDGNFSGRIDAHDDLTTLGIDVGNTFSGTMRTDTGFVSTGDVNIGDDFTGLIEAYTNLTTGDFNVGLVGSDFTGTLLTHTGGIIMDDVDVEGNFSGTINAGGGDVTFDNFYVGGIFSGTVQASSDIIVNEEATIQGDFNDEGIWEAGDDIFMNGDTFTVNGVFDGTIQADDDINGTMNFNSGPNHGKIIADFDNDNDGDMAANIYSEGAWAKGSIIQGAEISGSINVYDDFFGLIQSTFGDINSVYIDGDFGGQLISAGNLYSMEVEDMIVSDPVFWTIDVTGNIFQFEAGGLGEDVHMRAANWGLSADGLTEGFVTIGCDGIDDEFGELLATGGFVSNPPYGDIENLTIKGEHPEGPDLEAVILGNKTGVWKISEHVLVGSAGYTFHIEGGGSIFAKVKGGDVMIWYFDDQLNDGFVNEINQVVFHSGMNPDLTLTGSNGLNNSFPDIDKIKAPLMDRDPVTEDKFPTGFRDIVIKNLNVDSIYVTGSVRDIKITNGHLDELHIGDEDFLNTPFDDKGAVGALRNLTFKNGGVNEEISILDKLSGKITADYIGSSIYKADIDLGNSENTGSFGTIQTKSGLFANIDVYGNISTIKAGTVFGGDVDVHGNLGTLQSGSDFLSDGVNIWGNLGKLSVGGTTFDSDVNVWGNVGSITANKATSLDDDIIVHGRLGSLSMQKAAFTGYVEAAMLKSLDVLGGVKDRDVFYSYQTTAAQYDTGGELLVFDNVAAKQIK